MLVRVDRGPLVVTTVAHPPGNTPRARPLADRPRALHGALHGERASSSRPAVRVHLAAIFVNPTQFGRTKTSRAVRGCSIATSPAGQRDRPGFAKHRSILRDIPLVEVRVTDRWEGRTAGPFRGVATIVLKLLGTQPDAAYFGRRTTSSASSFAAWRRRPADRHPRLSDRATPTDGGSL
jgi:hypothetical protein